MPLEDGLNSDITSFRMADKVLTAFFEEKDAILSVLRNHPELGKRPYALSYDYHRNKMTCPSKFPKDNPIHMALVKAGLDRFGALLAKNGRWKNAVKLLTSVEGLEKKLYIEGFELIDAALYLVIILNIYEPNRNLIQNLIGTHTQIDALGRENLNAVQKSLEKVVKKFAGDTSFIDFYDNTARALIVLAKHDAAVLKISKTAGRGIDFERDCERRLVDGGFEVHITPMSGDFGADLIASKDDLGYAVQCKDTVKPVGVKAIQEAVAARSHYRTDYAVVCASGGFTEAAIELASSNRVILCNADQIVKRLDAV
ncbi:restriction endonuclease [Aquisediminimonas profunda]|uniref:restriction endonuclease n=1 Tax=Aquisediminimonas profunda TaxID=1550733 RepID=UPI001C62A360|nr:restriction endonuclease [Aquisediminimonas profunda]